MKCEKCGAEYRLVDGEKEERKLLPTLVKQALEGIDVSTTASDGKIIIKSNRRLENDEWKFVMDYVRANGGVWVSQGANSRWEI